LLLTACTTLRPTQASLIREGDRVEVLTTSGATLAFRVDSAGAQVLEGQTARGERVTVDHASISRLERREFAVGKTLGLSLGALVLLGVAGSDGWDNDDCPPGSIGLC